MRGVTDDTGTDHGKIEGAHAPLVRCPREASPRPPYQGIPFPVTLELVQRVRRSMRSAAMQCK
jgi:hypothetical protein